MHVRVFLVGVGLGMKRDSCNFSIKSSFGIGMPHRLTLYSTGHPPKSKSKPRSAAFVRRLRSALAARKISSNSA